MIAAKALHYMARKNYFYTFYAKWLGMSAYSNNYSSWLGHRGNFYAFTPIPSSFAIGTPRSYQTSYSNSFGGYTTDLTNTGGTTVGYSQLLADWAATTGVTHVLSKPTLSVVNATGSYADLLNVPIISTTG